MSGVWDNTACERCGDTPLAGGRFCLDHFHDLCEHGLAPRSRETCGTNAGYQAHRQRSERPCGACQTAHRAERVPA